MTALCTHGVQTGAGYSCSACVTTPLPPHAEAAFVAMTNFDVVRVLAGHTMTCRASDGTDIVVRLASADEFLAAHVAACAAAGTEPNCTRDKAIALTTPIGGDQ